MMADFETRATVLAFERLSGSPIRGDGRGAGHLRRSTRRLPRLGLFECEMQEPLEHRDRTGLAGIVATTIPSSG
jgi:hypothetical protein